MMMYDSWIQNNEFCMPDIAWYVQTFTGQRRPETCCHGNHQLRHCHTTGHSWSRSDAGNGPGWLRNHHFLKREIPAPSPVPGGHFSVHMSRWLPWFPKISDTSSMGSAGRLRRKALCLFSSRRYAGKSPNSKHDKSLLFRNLCRTPATQKNALQKRTCRIETALRWKWSMKLYN